MNTNIILDGFTAIINQLIAAAVAEAVKPLEERILKLEEGEWTVMEHVAAKAVQPMLNRIVALEINEAKGDFSEAIRNILIGYDYIKRAEAIDLVDKVVENAIEAYDFNDIIDWDNKVEEGINNYDFTDIIQEMLPEELDKDVVQDMINESLDNLTISRT